MPLALRSTDLGRIYEDGSASTPPELRWFWSITKVFSRPGFINRAEVRGDDSPTMRKAHPGLHCTLWEWSALVVIIVIVLLLNWWLFAVMAVDAWRNVAWVLGWLK